MEHAGALRSRPTLRCPHGPEQVEGSQADEWFSQSWARPEQILRPHLPRPNVTSAAFTAVAVTIVSAVRAAPTAAPPSTLAPDAATLAGMATVATATSAASPTVPLAALTIDLRKPMLGKVGRGVGGEREQREQRAESRDQGTGRREQWICLF
jgi:hypothetical protein